MSRDNDQKRCVYKERSAAPKSFINFHSKKGNHFFQLPGFYLVNPWFQHYCFLGQANLYWLCGLLQMSRQIWMSFLVQEDSNYLIVKIKLFKRDANRHFRLFQNVTKGEAELNRFIRLRKHLVNAA